MRTAWWGPFRMVGVVNLGRGDGSEEGTKKNTFLFTPIAAASRWDIGMEGVGDLFPSNRILELKTRLNEIIFSLLNF